MIRELATGITEEVDAATQRRFDDGHRCEALARPLAEQIIGEELFPCTGTDGKFSASFDGLTMLGEAAWEHKRLNDTLRAAMVDGCTGADLPEMYQVQMEQQAMVSGAERVLFMASNWDASGNLIEERHCWYTPHPDLRAQIVAGWEQLEADVAAYVPEPVAAPAPVGRAPDLLPSLHVQVTGMVTASNLAEFKASAMQVLGSINRDLQTDDDFANAESTVKWCKGVEDRLAATKEAVLAQTADIDAVFRTMDEVSAEARRIRLELDKLVKAEKENRKAEIVSRCKEAYRAHVESLMTETKGIWLNLAAPDLAGAIKGKRTLTSMQDAVDGVLANAKIAASESAKHIRAALACLTEETGEHKHLFPDYRDFIAKPIDDIRALVRGRIAEHQQREAEKLEAERGRIRQEEAEKLAREAAEKAAAEVEAQKREQAAVATRDQLTAPEKAPTRPTLATSTPAPATSAGVRIKLGDINDRIAPLSITADGLARLGFQPVGTERAAKLYRLEDLRPMCHAMARVLERAYMQDAA